MFRPVVRKTPGRSAFAMLELIFHATVRSIRRSHGNAVIGLLLNILQTVIMVVVFYVMFDLLGLRGNAIRGDFLLYVMSGIFLFMTHTKAVGAVVSSDGPTSAMMKHAPMNPIIAIAAAALSALYIQILSAGVVLFIYHAAFTPITLFDPVGTMGMLFLAWGSGVAVGMVFKAAMPWQPEFIGILSTIYQRANMIASGKMFVANAMPTYVLAYFDWNPLFHIIDQARGFIFLNYNPHYSSIRYAVTVMVICILIGLMGEFYTRKHASSSWGAKR
ncbi:ABC transporter permease [Pseudorhodobacter sp. MZDSW-24AT]|uniref:ABC transporter permease n=1 Tax=Pseudorhodobacter sp. MZDSW-24AT TaxID=2052957 RepID=UPI000C1DD0AE|nr:ABC transporter permease [Pseudorhodobacter sp. MZDSW-24AT]PJF10035.1 ABC transporter permease [Pseudorhodobacter sp. MZDSW-24AT]